MKKTLLLLLVPGLLNVNAQDSTQSPERASKPVQIFSSEKAINANTTETVGKGKMAFKVTHNFGDIAGSNGGIKRFFGLDNTTDVKIGFQVGIGNKFDIIAARAKGAGPVQQLWELGLKYKLLEQMQDGSGSPITMAVYANTVVSSQEESAFPNQESSFEDFGDRLSNVLQLIMARRFGNVSVALVPTYVTRGHAISYDEKSFFALGGAIRVPVIANRLNLLVDYFHTFRDDAVKNSFYTEQGIRFYDPLGVGFEIMTTGHIFRLNFTNATEILENRFIPRTVTSWSKGQYRWGFTISRNFTLWR